MKIEECFFKNNNFEKYNINTRYCNFHFEKNVLSNIHQKKEYEGESNN